MDKIVYKVGDIIVGTMHNKGHEKTIVKVNKKGYTWKYPESDTVFNSENSTDPFFDFGWELKK